MTPSRLLLPSLVGLAAVATVAGIVTVGHGSGEGTRLARGSSTHATQASSDLLVPLPAGVVGLDLASDGASGVYVLAQETPGRATIVHVTEGKTTSWAVSLTEGTQLGAATAFLWADDGLWLAESDAVLRLDPATGAVTGRFAPPSGPAARSALEGDWVSSVAVHEGILVVARNATAALDFIDTATSATRQVPIPAAYAGAQSLAVDSAGYVYLAAAEASPGSVAVLDPQGKLVAELSVTATAVSSDVDGTVWLPAEGGCESYRAAALVHRVPMGSRTPTACQAAAGIVLGWNPESGGFATWDGTVVTDVRPSPVPTTVVGPTGQSGATTVRDMPRGAVLTGSGTVWTLAQDGTSVTRRG